MLVLGTISARVNVRLHELILIRSFVNPMHNGLKPAWPLQVYDNDPFEEKANLYLAIQFIIIGPPGVGKSHAARHPCQMPLKEKLEGEDEQSLLDI